MTFAQVREAQRYERRQRFLGVLASMDLESVFLLEFEEMIREMQRELADNVARPDLSPDIRAYYDGGSAALGAFYDRFIETVQEAQAPK